MRCAGRIQNDGPFVLFLCAFAALVFISLTTRSAAVIIIVIMPVLFRLPAIYATAKGYEYLAVRKLRREAKAG